MEVFRNGVAYVGLGDVVGGKMWFCVNKTKGMDMVWFWTKKECEKYIRDSFSGDDKNIFSKNFPKGKGVHTHIVKTNLVVINLAARYDYSLKVYIMERKELNELTNDVGVRYLDYVYDWEIIGVEEDYDGMGYLYPIAIIKGWPNENERYLGVIYLGKKDSGNGAGFFSRFEYFCRIAACRKSGINPKYDHKGDIIWPAWYCTEAQHEVFIKEYNALHKKYDKFIKSDCA